MCEDGLVTVVYMMVMVVTRHHRDITPADRAAQRPAAASRPASTQSETSSHHVKT